MRLVFEAGEENVFLAGKTGCGKSTLLRTLNGLIPDFYGGKLRGVVSVYGRKGNPEDVYLVTQHPEEQIVCSTVLEEVAFSLVQRGVEWRDARRIAEDTLEKVNAYHLCERKTETLSDGEKQLVTVCSAIASESRCLAFDEPFAHLHPDLARKVLDILLSDERTVVVSEHRLELSERFDRVHWMGGESAIGVNLTKENIETRDCLERKRLLVRAKNASIFRGRRQVVEGLDFEVFEGEIVAVTGLNGSGKTTLLRAIAGLEKSDGIEVHGKPFMSFQYPGYTLNSGTVGGEVPAELLKTFGLEKYADRHPHSLSSGERRILAALKALRGKIVLLDEPTAGLDETLRIAFISKLIRIVRESSRCAIIATHDSSIAKLCDFEICL